MSKEPERVRKLVEGIVLASAGGVLVAIIQLQPEREATICGIAEAIVTDDQHNQRLLPRADAVLTASAAERLTQCFKRR